MEPIVQSKATRTLFLKPMSFERKTVRQRNQAKKPENSMPLISPIP